MNCDLPASMSVYTTTVVPIPGPFGIYTITTTKTQTIPLTTTTTTTTTTKTITTDGFDFFGQRRTTTVYNTVTEFNNFTTTQIPTSTSLKSIVQPTPSKVYVTVTATPSKEYITITTTPSKEYVTVTATPSKEYITVTSIPSREYVTVTASPLTFTSTVTITKTPSGLFDNLFGTQSTTETAATIANSFCSNTLGGGVTKILTKSETETVTATITSLQPVTVVSTTTVIPFAPLTTQTSPTVSMPDASNILSIILKVIQALQGNKPPFNPVIDLIKSVTQQAVKQNDEKNIQAVMSFVFDLIQKNGSQNNNNPFPFTEKLMIKDNFEDQAIEWLTNQFEVII